MEFQSTSNIVQSISQKKKEHHILNVQTKYKKIISYWLKVQSIIEEQS